MGAEARAQNGSLLIDGPTSTIALELGPKAARFSDTHTAEKLVIPVARR